jgi:hypothetical protein
LNRLARLVLHALQPPCADCFSSNS